MISVSRSLLVLSILAGIILAVRAHTNIEDQKMTFQWKPNLNLMPDIRWVNARVREDDRFEGFHLVLIRIQNSGFERFQLPMIPNPHEKLLITMTYHPVQDGQLPRSETEVDMEFDWPGPFRPQIDGSDYDHSLDALPPINIDRDLRLEISRAATIVYDNFNKRLPSNTQAPFRYNVVRIGEFSPVEDSSSIYQPVRCSYTFFCLEPHPGNNRFIGVPVEQDGFRADLAFAFDFQVKRRPEWMRRKLHLAAAS